jgi:uncharacterized membrane protein
LILAMFIASACAWPYVPEKVPVHWNIHGEVDRHGGRFEGLFLVPLIASGLYGLLRVLPKLDPRQVNYRQFAGPYAVIRCALMAFLAVVHASLLLAALGRPIPIGTIVPALVGTLLIIIGAFMPRIKSNWFVGVRTPWTLSSELSWTKTHRLAAWLLPLSGVAILLAGFLRTQWAVYTMLGALLGSAVGLVVYSYFVWRQDPSRNRSSPPANEIS